jgi:hypothetical protein
MRLTGIYGLMLAAAVSVTCGCAVATATPPNSTEAQGFAKAAAPAGLRRGVYVLGSSAIYGFRADNPDNDAPFCRLPNFAYSAGNIAFDTKGRMIVPDYAASTITVYDAPTKPNACGKVLGAIQDTYGKPIDAASLDAAGGRIVVASQDRVEICSLRQGCTASLSAPNLDTVSSIALWKNGDCWAQADATSGPGILDYFKGCDNDGEETTGYEGGEDNFGGIYLDEYGNIVSIFANYKNSSALYVYSGCNPACTMVSGPLPLRGNGSYGDLNKASSEFFAADYQYSSVDVFKYTPKSLIYEYSFDAGLSGGVYGVAFNPRAAE